MIVTADGWLDGVRRRPSPNQDARPDAHDISLIVLHGISLPPGEFGGDAVKALFLNRLDCAADQRLASLEGVRVSAHLFIDRTGAVTQFVPFHRRSWHAGVSCHAGRAGCNDYAIGIELEGTDDTPYEDAQYGSLGVILPALLAAYPRIDGQAIVGHSEIAPGRKTDPGAAFDWRRTLGALFG